MAKNKQQNTGKSAKATKTVAKSDKAEMDKQQCCECPLAWQVKLIWALLLAVLIVAVIAICVAVQK